MEQRNLTFEAQLEGGRDRLQELVVYIAKNMAGAQRLGKVKLNKTLWRCDFNSFRVRGVPVTGRAYHKMAAGPMPVEIELVYSSLINSGALRFETIEWPGDFVESRPIVLIEANMSLFSSDDIYYADEAINYYRHKSATYASDLSHGIAWKSRKFTDLIPYDAVLFSDERMGQEQRNRIMEKLEIRRSEKTQG